jgi:hypothetical protein
MYPPERAVDLLSFYTTAPEDGFEQTRHRGTGH